jgi:hypothetical protein
MRPPHPGAAASAACHVLESSSSPCLCRSRRRQPPASCKLILRLRVALGGIRSRESGALAGSDGDCSCGCSRQALADLERETGRSGGFGCIPPVSARGLLPSSRAGRRQRGGRCRACTTSVDDGSSEHVSAIQRLPTFFVKYSVVSFGGNTWGGSWTDLDFQAWLDLFL